MDDLKGLVALKGKMEVLENKKKELVQSLEGVDKQLDALQKTLQKLANKSVKAKSPVSGRKKTGDKKSPGRKKKAKKARKRFSQPSLSTVVVEVLGEKKKPMKVTDLCDTVLKEKKYKTRAKNFKSQLRILLYKNDKKLYKKVGPGLFTLSASAAKGKK